MSDAGRGDSTQSGSVAAIGFTFPGERLRGQGKDGLGPGIAELLWKDPSKTTGFQSHMDFESELDYLCDEAAGFFPAQSNQSQWFLKADGSGEADAKLLQITAEKDLAERLLALGGDELFFL
jgi:hypothetical protein